MRKIILLFFAAVSVSLFSSAQTLFTYGKNSVDAKEFLRAYQKTQTAPVANKEKAMREYLQLFIHSKLKVKEARERGYDTTAAFREEIAALRSQIADNYMTDKETFDKLLNEAFARSQKDIRVSHIFIPYKVDNNNMSDSLLSKENINKAYKELQSGKSFEEVALQFSKDPAVHTNKGDIGFITVFSLPYEFENIIYNLAAGKYAAPYKSSIGYHIFKKTAERKALGKIKAAQILFAIPPGSDEAAKNKLKNLADSVYNQLAKGADFGNMAKQFSNDYITAASDGKMPEFGIGTYDPLFESTVWGLKNGDISKPFLTAHGYHIVKKISTSPVPVSLNDKNVYDVFKSQLEKDPRIELTKEALYKKVLAKSGYRPIPVDEKELWLFADSMLDYKQTRTVFKISRETPLFKLGDIIKTVGDFLTYAQSNRYIAFAPGVKPHPRVMEEFKKQVAFDYYREHLESFNADFKNQMDDFRDGNLFFEIMMKEIWAPAQSDSAAQKEFYEKNKSKYQWKNSAAAIVFYCSDEQTANLMLAGIKKDPVNWEKVSVNYGDRSTIDSGRFEITKIPGMKNLAAKPGLLTGVEVNKDDNSAAFSYITHVYTGTAQKTFEEAKSDVITDYQNALEARWLADLKKKYPVKINEETLKKIVK